MTVSSTTNKHSYNGNGSQTAFAYTFKIFVAADIKVYLDGVLKTINTHYTLSNVGVTGGGNVTFTSGSVPVSATGNVILLRSLALTQGVDLINYGAFDANIIESAYDKLTMMVQQLQEEVSRSIRFSATVYDGGTQEVSDTVANRAGKVLAYDASGNISIAAELGDWKGNWATNTAFELRDLVLDSATNNVYICVLAHTSGTLSSDVSASKWSLVINAAAVAASAATATTKASEASTSASTASTQATNSANSATAAASSASTATTKANTATTQASTATTKASEASTSASNAATSASTASTQATNSANSASAGATSATASANSATAAASSASTATTKASEATTNGAAQVALATTQAGLATTNGAAQVALATTQAGLATTNGAAQVTLATAQKAIAVTKASEASASASTASTQATAASSSATAAASSATASASSASNAATTTALTMGAGSTNPTTAIGGGALVTGALFFNTSANSMKVYNGTSWGDAGSAVNGTSNRTVTVATANQTTFSVVYDSGFVDVFVNGIKLQITVDYNASSGTAIVLTSGATVGDIVDIVSYGAFALADVYTKVAADARYPQKANNLSDLANAATARTNLGLVIGTNVQAYDATIMVDGDIGTTVQAYDANTAKLDEAANFTGTLQNGGSNVIVDSDIGTTVLAPNGSGANLTNLPAGGATSINGLSDGTNDASSVGLGTNALANDDGTTNQNTAVGTDALIANTSGWKNTAVGWNALKGNLTGLANSSFGHLSSANITTGGYNVAVGLGALYDTTTGSFNVATGASALRGNTTGSNNTATGHYALYSSTTGGYNTASGRRSGFGLTTGSENSFYGHGSGQGVTTGTSNTFIGKEAGLAIGAITGHGNSCLGRDSNPSSTSVDNEITLGISNIATLRCQVTTITALSDERDKTDITDLDAGLDFINCLRPVDFTWNMRDGGKVGIPDVGFIAQELQQAQITNNKVIPQLIMDENPDKLEAGYGALLPVMVKAIKELSAKNDALEARLAVLEETT